MVIIHFQNGAGWYNANWVFRQLADDVCLAFSEAKAINIEMQKAQAFGALFIDTLDKEIAPRVLRALKTVAELTVDGKIEGWKRSRPDDKEGQKSYLEAMSELVTLLREG